MDDDLDWIDEPVTITKGQLDHLLMFAKAGDVATSQRMWRYRFRHVPICSDPETREPDCYSCQAYTAAEEALATA